MENVNYIDIVIVGLCLILGIKGVINGLIKEFFGLAGIVGGAFVGSRYSGEVGSWIDTHIYQLENSAAINLVGFVLTMAAVWMAAIIAGNLLSAALKSSGMGSLDRLFGFLFGAGKIFLVFSILFYALSNVTFVSRMTQDYTKDSMVYPIMLEVGETVIRIDPDTIIPDVGDSIGEVEIGSKETSEPSGEKQEAAQ